MTGATGGTSGRAARARLRPRAPFPSGPRQSAEHRGRRPETDEHGFPGTIPFASAGELARGFHSPTNRGRALERRTTPSADEPVYHGVPRESHGGDPSLDGGRSSSAPGSLRFESLFVVCSNVLGDATDRTGPIRRSIRDQRLTLFSSHVTIEAMVTSAPAAAALGIDGLCRHRLLEGGCNRGALALFPGRTSGSRPRSRPGTIRPMVDRDPFIHKPWPVLRRSTGRGKLIRR